MRLSTRCLPQLNRQQFRPRGLSPRALNPNVPPAFDGIVRKATTSDIGISYTSITNMLVDLQSCREDLRNNKPLTWSPLGGPNPPPRAPKAAPGLITQAATELAQEGKKTAKQPSAPPTDYYDEPQQGGSPLAGRLLTFLIVILIIGFISVVAVVSTMLTVSPDVTIPNLVGKPLTDAQKLGAGQFTVVEADHDYNDTWPVNTIYAQDPTAGHTIKKESRQRQRERRSPADQGSGTDADDAQSGEGYPQQRIADLGHGDASL